MSQALTVQEAITWRQKPYSVRGYVHFSEPAIVLQCLVNQSTFTYPIYQISYDNVTLGSHTNVVFGMTVCVRDSSGNIKGFGRVRLSPTASVLYIGHVSQGEINFADNDSITVYRDFRPFARIPYINPLTGEQFKDLDIEYSNQNENIPPKANAGAWYAARPTSGNSITVDFYSSSSHANATGASISSRLWDIQDGTLLSGNLTDMDIEVSFPVGERWVSLTVTDSNGTTHTAYSLVVNNPSPTPTTISRLSCNLDNGGWEAEFTIHADEIDILPGTAVIHWVEESFGDTSGSLTGYPERESVKFIGWVKEVRQNISGLKDTYTVTCIGPLGMSQHLPAFSNTLQRIASPTAWHEVEDLTHWKVIWHQLYWHTTLHLMCDIFRPAYHSTYPVGSLDVDAGTIYNQMKGLAANVGAKYTCDRTGIFYFNICRSGGR